MKLSERYRQTRLYYLYNSRNEAAKGRQSLLWSTTLNSIINCLATGAFYTAFLTIYGLNIVNVGIITFIPYIAALFGFLNPMLLERLKRRKPAIALARGLYHTLNLLGVTLLPVFVTGSGERIICLSVIIFTANFLNFFAAAGINAWYLDFLPEDVRPDHYAFNTLIPNIVAQTISFTVSLAADAVSVTPYAHTVIIAIRYFAFALSLFDMVILLRPREHDYEHRIRRPRPLAQFGEMLRHRKFLVTVLVVAFHAMSINMAGASVIYYLLNTCGMKYSFNYFINLLYPLVLLLTQPLWKRLLLKISWFRTYSVAIFIEGISHLFYCLINPVTYIWVMPIARIVQHFAGAGTSLVSANMLYINMPTYDRSNFTSTYSILVNGAVLLGMMMGTGFVALTSNSVVTILGISFGSVQMLLFMIGILELMTFLFLRSVMAYIKPEDKTV